MTDQTKIIEVQKLLDQHTTGVKNLYRYQDPEGGLPIHDPPTHEKKLAELDAWLNSHLDDLATQAQGEITEAQRRVEALGTIDPLASLDDTEAQRAASLREFVKEDVNGLSVEALTRHVRSTLANSSDKPRLALYSRYAGQRLQAELKTARGQERRRLEDLQAALGEVNAALTDEKIEKRRRIAQNDLDRANRLYRDARTARPGHRQEIKARFGI